MKNRAFALVLFSCCILPLMAASAPPPPRSVYRPALILQWKDRLHVANEKLQEANWKKGFDIADAVLREMRDRIASGEASGSLLAVALLFRSIGEAGLGRTEDAAWDFGTAQALYPPYSRVDLKPYGAAGVVLDTWRYKDGAPTDPRRTAFDPAMAGVQVTPPRKIKGDSPEYPLAKANSCIEHPIVVQCVINEQGHPEYPYVSSDTDPVLALAAFDALRSWRFEPAQLDGKPVRVSYSLTFNFQVRQCY